MALISNVEGRSWGADKYGDQILSWKWNWHDDRIMSWINNFVAISQKDVHANVDRQKAIRTGRLKRSLAWKTYATSGGDEQVFEARYIYYAKYVELAVGRRQPFKALPPMIPNAKWQPIRMPDRKRKAKPHVVTEMRSQAKKFTSMARRHFSFVGTAYLVFAMGSNKSSAAAINRALFWESKSGKFDR